MRYSFLMILAFLPVLLSSASSCGQKEGAINTKNDDVMTTTNGKIKIKVNAQTYTATLLDNNSAKTFRDMLPLTVTMVELNGNEKYYDLPTNLPTASANPETIKNGDLMLYGSKTLVLFYKTFSTSYSYTKLGAIDDVAGLNSALGSGDVTVTFEIE